MVRKIGSLALGSTPWELNAERRKDLAGTDRHRRLGRDCVAAALQAAFAQGNGEIDLRQARFIDGETTIHATAIIGNITVVVPEDADVHIGGTGIIGGFDHHDEGPGTPGQLRETGTVSGRHPSKA